jgi:hypothetical protein
MGDTVGYAVLTVPHVAVNNGYAWTSGDASLDMLIVSISGTSFEGTLGDAALSMPNATVSGTAPNTIGTASLEIPLALVTGEEGGLAFIELPLPSVSGMGYQSTLGSASLTLPIAEVSGSNDPNTTGTASLTIPLIQVTGTTYAGTFGNASLHLPMPEISGVGYFNTTGTASLTLPLPQISGYAPEVVVLVDVNGDNESLSGYALVLNLRNMALTEYDNYGFNSFCHFNGRYLGATSAGIFNLTGRDDNGTKIRAKARTDLQDGNTALRKGIEDAFLGISADDTMTAKVVTDGYDTFNGLPVNPRKDELVTERVKFGKGIKSRYLGIELENRAGCDFTLESAELVIIPLTRKI